MGLALRRIGFGPPSGIIRSACPNLFYSLCTRGSCCEKVGQAPHFEPLRRAYSVRCGARPIFSQPRRRESCWKASRLDSRLRGNDRYVQVVLELFLSSSRLLVELGKSRLLAFAQERRIAIVNLLAEHDQLATNGRIG